MIEHCDALQQTVFAEQLCPDGTSHNGLVQCARSTEQHISMLNVAPDLSLSRHSKESLSWHLHDQVIRHPELLGVC